MIGDDRYSSLVKVTVIHVTNISIVVLPANPERKMFFISHDSAGQVYFCFKQAASVGSATLFIDSKTNYQWPFTRYFYTGPISAIRASGNSDIVVTEFL